MISTPDGKKVTVEGLQQDILSLKKQRDAVILAHLYQRDEIQAIADYTGDSLELSRKAVETDASVIEFCGAEFMAETAAILNPEKTVLIPSKQADCPLAAMASAEAVQAQKALLPSETKVVSYVNTFAEVKAVSDICCTSSNAVDVVKSLEGYPVLFVPDRNLGQYAESQIYGEINLWDGYCYVHQNIHPSTIRYMQRLHPSAEIMVHPECPSAVIRMADFVGSTAQMLTFASQSGNNEFIVGTENGILYRLSRENPEKEFYPVGAVCHGMKSVTLPRLKYALTEMRYTVTVPSQIRKPAQQALERMLEI